LKVYKTRHNDYLTDVSHRNNIRNALHIVRDHIVVNGHKIGNFGNASIFIDGAANVIKKNINTVGRKTSHFIGVVIKHTSQCVTNTRQCNHDTANKQTRYLCYTSIGIVVSSPTFDTVQNTVDDWFQSMVGVKINNCSKCDKSRRGNKSLIQSTFELESIPQLIVLDFGGEDDTAVNIPESIEVSFDSSPSKYTLFGKTYHFDQHYTSMMVLDDIVYEYDGMLYDGVLQKKPQHISIGKRHAYKNLERALYIKCNIN
jgi:hypothetical protein